MSVFDSLQTAALKGRQTPLPSQDVPSMKNELDFILRTYEPTNQRMRPTWAAFISSPREAWASGAIALTKWKPGPLNLLPLLLSRPCN